MFLNGNDRSRFNSCSLYAGLAAIIWKALLRKKDLGLWAAQCAQWLSESECFSDGPVKCAEHSLPGSLHLQPPLTFFNVNMRLCLNSPHFLSLFCFDVCFFQAESFFLLFHSCASVWSARKHPLSAHSPAVVAWALECGRFYSGLMTNEGYNCLVFHTSVCPFASFFWHGCISSLDLRVGKIM